MRVIRVDVSFWAPDIGRNAPSQLYKDRLHGIITLPLGKAGELLRVDDAVMGVDTGKVNLADKLDGRGFVGVFRAAVHLEAVNAVLVNGLCKEEEDSYVSQSCPSPAEKEGC